MDKDAMSIEEMQAVKELIQKIPPKALEKAVGGMDKHTKKVLREFFSDVLTIAAGVGAGWLAYKYLPSGGSNDSVVNPSNATPVTGPKSTPVEKVYRYRTDKGIVKAYRDKRLKSITEVCAAYRCLHKNFKGTNNDIQTILCI